MGQDQVTQDYSGLQGKGFCPTGKVMGLLFSQAFGKHERQISRGEYLSSVMQKPTM